MRPKLVALGGLVAAAAVGLKVSRHKRAPTERVDLFYDDGSVITLTGADAQPLLETARAAFA